MRAATLFLSFVLIGVMIMSFVPESQGHLSRGRKIRIAKKLGAMFLLHRKKYLFAVPFPLPIPLPLLKKTQPIIYKEKVPVPVPVPEVIPEPIPVHEPYSEGSYHEESPYNVPY